MNINISVRNTEITPDTKSYAIEKAQKLEKIYRLRRIEIVMEVEADQYKLEIVAHPERGHTIVATARANDWFGAVDIAHDKAERQLRKEKEKRTSHRVKRFTPEDRSSNEDNIMMY